RDGEGEGERVRVAVLQGNIDQGVKWSPEWFESTLETYVDLTREAAAAGAEVVVWPESALPAALEVDGDARDLLANLARAANVALVVGAVGIEAAGAGEPPHVYDSAFVMAPDGAPQERYDKTHLVPFGEYVPFQELLGSILSAVARGIATIGVTAGAAPRALVVP